MAIKAAVKYLLLHPAFLQLVLLAGLLVCIASPRLLILGLCAFFAGIVPLIAILFSGLGPETAVLLFVFGAAAGLFIGWHMTRRVRWFWFSGARRRVFHTALVSLFTLTSLYRAFLPQIEEYRLMRSLISADQPDRVMILKQGGVPAIANIPFFLDRFGVDERNALFWAMLDGSDVFWKEQPVTFSTLIHWAVDRRDRKLTGVALNWLNDQNMAPSWLAQQNWSADDLRFLIENGLNILKKDKNDTIFAEELIVKNTYLDVLFPVLMENAPNLPEILTRDGVRTYLELLASRNQALILADLAHRGFDLTARGEGGRTLLHHLAIGSRGANGVPPLVQAGIDVNARDDYGLTALHYASFDTESLATLFLFKSCPINGANKRGETPLFLAVDLNHDIPFSNLPAMQNWLSINNRAGNTIALALLEANATPCLTDKAGNSALHYALMKKSGGRLSPVVVEMLLERGANPLLATKKGLTPLGVLMPYQRDSSNYYGPDSDIERIVAMLKDAEESFAAH